MCFGVFRYHFKLYSDTVSLSPYLPPQSISSVSPVSVSSTISDGTWCLSADTPSPSRSPCQVFCLNPIPNHNACDEAFLCPRFFSLTTVGFTTVKHLQKPRAGTEQLRRLGGIEALLLDSVTNLFTQPFLVACIDFDLFVKLWTQGDSSPFLVPLLLSIPM